MCGGKGDVFCSDFPSIFLTNFSELLRITIPFYIVFIVLFSSEIY